MSFITATATRFISGMALGAAAVMYALGDSEFSTAIKAGVFASAMFLSSLSPTTSEIIREGASNLLNKLNNQNRQIEEQELKSVLYSLLGGITVGVC